MKTSRHADRRKQQRGITSDSLSIIVAFGEKQHDGHGGIRYLISKTSIEKLHAVLGRTQQISDLIGMYAVVSAQDGQVITVGHQYR